MLHICPTCGKYSEIPFSYPCFAVGQPIFQVNENGLAWVEKELSRDEIAIAALTGFISRGMVFTNDQGKEVKITLPGREEGMAAIQYAKLAYKVADAMIEERERRKVEKVAEVQRSIEAGEKKDDQK